METFYDVFGVVAAICSGIVFLAIFFTCLNWFNRATRGFEVVKMRGFIKEGKVVNVYLNGVRTVRGVYFVGFTERASAKGGIPYQMAGMVVLETVNGGRILIRADSVRMIEEVEDTVAG